MSIAPPGQAHAAATIVVNTTADEDLQNATCSLREAIVAANTNASYKGCGATGAGVGDMIVFDLDTPTINVGSTSFPAIVESVTIDGGAERVELHGPGAPRVAGKHGLIVDQGGAGTTIRNLVVNNFSDVGIYINADNVSVLGCFIGTDASGTMAAPNQGHGVQVFAGSGARIGGATSGGPCMGDCNVISGAINNNANVHLSDAATGAVVRGNFIGTDVTGTAEIPNNTLDGVQVRGSGNSVGGTNGTTPGGTCTGDCNVLSGMGRGVYIGTLASNTTVRGNFIGTDVTGTMAIANNQGIESFPANVVIGGTVPAARNLLSGNTFAGILLRGISPVVQGNYFGTNSAGTAVVPGTLIAISIYQAVGPMIGGTMPGAGNLIAGVSSGVSIEESTNTQVFGNRFGTAADGSTPLPNATGVVVSSQSSQNVIGSPVAGAGNLIAFSMSHGVVVNGQMPPVRGNSIRGNSIHSNGAEGIDLSNNANDNLAPPTILGNDPLHGTACAPCAVDIYSDADNEGRVFEGTAFTNDGNWTYNAAVSGPRVTATSTDMSNNTSEFSAPFTVASPTPTHSPTSVPTASPTQTRTSTRTLTRTATVAPSSTASGAPTATRTPLSTATQTLSRTATSTLPFTATRTPSLTATRTPPLTATRTPSLTATRTPPSTATPTLPPTATPTVSSTATSPPSSSATSTQPVTATPSPSGAATPSPTPSATPTSTVPAGATPTATAAPLCVGDCDGGSTVAIGELVTLVNIALGTAQPSACAGGVPDRAAVDIALLIQAVNNALNGCGASA